MTPKIRRAPTARSRITGALTGDIRGLRIGIVRHLYEDDVTVAPARCGRRLKKPTGSSARSARRWKMRTADSRSGTRKTMIVALARKLIIALWRFRPDDR